MANLFLNTTVRHKRVYNYNEKRVIKKTGETVSLTLKAMTGQLLLES